MIKQLFITLTAVCLLAIGLTTNTSVFAQTQQKLLLVVTPYKPMQNLDFFFLNSIHPLKYIEVSEGGDIPVFVSIVTLEQKEAYEKAGYKPIIVDENPGALRQYYVMTTKKHKTPNVAEQLQNLELKQQGLELAYQLTRYNTLLKLSPGTSFSQLTIPAVQHFNARQIRSDMVPPTGRTSISSASPKTNSEKHAKEETQKLIASWFFLLAILTFLLISLRRKSRG